MVNGSQWKSTSFSRSQRKSTRAMGAQRSMEINKSQRYKLVARESAGVNKGQRESTWVLLSTPHLSQARHWIVSFFLSLLFLYLLVFFVINYFDAG